ncbi:bacillithiol system redox-active protein YtxJ [Piscibacillus salipiscarius]|uniref:Bacillithiol system redox-active protein YtxJ n=1 Tax=Piscibacillus salipiscarius TaxID=299480 RepID=A0ABW5QE23_9BACI
MKELTSVEEFKGVIEQQDQFVLLKHSLTCPISGEAKSQIEDFKSANEVPTYIIPIQNYRELSNYVSVFFGIKHESPQVFYIKNGQVEYHTSHWHITRSKMEEVTK